VRPAEPRDLDDLVQLRLENGRVHAVLDPSVYRVPDSKAVRQHFDARLMADDNDQVLLVAVVDGRVLGLAEVSLNPPPPAHQILLPVRARTCTWSWPPGRAAKGWAADLSLPHASGLVPAASSNSSPASRSTTRPRSTSTTAAATALTPQSDSGTDRRVRKSIPLR